jgi:hypothetical protein
MKEITELPVNEIVVNIFLPSYEQALYTSTLLSTFTTRQKPSSMKIKKRNTNQPSERQARLKSYRSQARNLRDNCPSISGISFAKGSLAAIIPLAAAGAVQAQCLPAVGTITLRDNFNSNEAGTYKFGLDVDGDGMSDFSIANTFSDEPCIFQVLGLNPKPNFYVRAVNGNLVDRLAGSVSVTRNQVNFINDGAILCYQRGNCQYGLPNVQRGEFCAGTGQGYFAIRKGDNITGRPGWVSFEFVSPQTYPIRIRIGERFLAAPGNNVAQTGNCNPPLPVEMTYFQVEVLDKRMLLEWETATEINSAGFEIHRSNDGMSFSKIGWVAGQGNSSASHIYQFEDADIQANTNYYYRLKQLDSDGTFTYSPIRTAMIKDANKLNVGELFPNPTSRDYGFAMFKLNVPEPGEVVVDVFDLRGSNIKSFTSAFAAGSSTLSVPVADLPRGHYVVKMQLGAAMAYRKLLVE